MSMMGVGIWQARNTRLGAVVYVTGEVVVKRRSALVDDWLLNPRVPLG